MDHTYTQEECVSSDFSGDEEEALYLDLVDDLEAVLQDIVQLGMSGASPDVVERVRVVARILDSLVAPSCGR